MLAGTPQSPDKRHSWTSVLGTVVVVLGVFLTAQYGNEWLKQTVMTANAPPAGQTLQADCPPAELEEEGLSVAECHFLVSRVQGILASTPPWFAGFHTGLAASGTFVALLSVMAGVTAVSRGTAALPVLTVTLLVLLVMDLLRFIAVINTGPVLRELYLGNSLLWLLLHLMMSVSAAVGWRQGRCSAPSP